MNIQNIQQPYPPVSVEDLVNKQEHKYPKPSIPQELNDKVTLPVEPKDEYSQIKNEAEATIEANAKNVKQEITEEVQDYTPSLSDGQTLKLQANVTQNKIEAYKAGSGQTPEEDTEQFNIRAAQEQTFETMKDLKDLQEIIHKQKGIETYQTNLGLLK